MSQSELALWLESEADYKDGLANGAIEYATTLAHAEYHNDARQANSRAARLRKHAADLRAAAHAVRLVGTCKAALSKSKRTSKGWYEDTSAALDAINTWEAPLPAPPEVGG